MDEDLKTYLEAMESRLRGHTEAVETRLLGELWKWARTADARYRQSQGVVDGLNYECGRRGSRLGTRARAGDGLRCARRGDGKIEALELGSSRLLLKVAHSGVGLSWQSVKTVLGFYVFWIVRITHRCFVTTLSWPLD